MKKLLMFLICCVSIVVYADTSEYSTPVDNESGDCLTIKDNYAYTHTKIIFKYGSETGFRQISGALFLDPIAYYILDVSDQGEIKVLKKYSEGEFENILFSYKDKNK